MDFTREPIIETVITPKEGYKLVIRSSKAAGQEEFFVDALEVVAFGPNLFFRSLEKPKAFLVPTNDYEVLEVREARMVLKHVGLERAIKIGGGKEASHKNLREVEKDLPPPLPPIAVPAEAAIAAPSDAPIPEDKGDGRFERKRERRRQYRRRRGREEGAPREDGTWAEGSEENETVVDEAEVKNLPVTPSPELDESNKRIEVVTSSALILSSLLPPPPNLISETLARYRENDMFKDAFFFKEQAADRLVEKIAEPTVPVVAEEHTAELQDIFPEELALEEAGTPPQAEPIHEAIPAFIHLQTSFIEPKMPWLPPSEDDSELPESHPE